MKTMLARYLSIPLVCFLTACTPRYAFEVDSISNPEMGMGQSFVLISADPSIRENDLRFREASSYVKLALEGLGLYEAANVNRADMIIELDYYLGEPRESLTVRSHPETYWAPGRHYSVEIPLRNDKGKIVGYSRKVYHEPSRQYTRWEDRLESQTLYEKALTMTAFDNRAGSAVENPIQLWSVTVINTDASNDLRRYLPFMAAAALPYVGIDTGRKTLVVVSEEEVASALGTPLPR